MEMIGKPLFCFNAFLFCYFGSILMCYTTVVSWTTARNISLPILSYFFSIFFLPLFFTRVKVTALSYGRCLRLLKTFLLILWVSRIVDHGALWLVDSLRLRNTVTVTYWRKWATSAASSCRRVLWENQSTTVRLGRIVASMCEPEAITPVVHFDLLALTTTR